jgi:dinuclear metal center YbgI/SA1388 family protein
VAIGRLQLARFDYNVINTMKIKEIIDAIEAYAPPRLQESFDNTGYQVGDRDSEATGALLCVDVTEEIIEEAVAKGFNLIIAHHPLIFRGIKSVTGANRPERALAKAILSGVTVYSSHTAMDSTVGGVSWRMARLLGLEQVEVLVPSSPGAQTGLGVVGNLPQPLSQLDFAHKVKTVFNCASLRMSRSANGAPIKRVALCGGSAGEFITDAIASGAQAYVTADCKLNQFIDHAHAILLLDAGHFETEACTKQIFFDVITEKFPNFALCYSEKETNPIIYL